MSMCRATRTDREDVQHHCKRQEGHKSMHACTATTYQWTNKKKQNRKKKTK